MLDRRGARPGATGGEVALSVEVPLDQEIHVHYGQFYVQSSRARAGGDLHACFRGQSTGLCGAAVPGELFLITGLHTGNVRCRVEVHPVEPPLDDAWEEIVEASFTAASDDVQLVQWAGEAAWPLGLTADDYRVRYSAHGMDDARRADTRLDDEPLLDRYRLQFWPAPPAPDRVLRQLTRQAAYWHDVARSLPPPPTAEELAERELLKLIEQERRQAESRATADRRRWGGRAPNDRLRAVRGNVHGLEKIDLDLVFALAEADDATLRAVARWAVERAYDVAGLAGLRWVAPALTALRDGRPLPPPFDDLTGVWAHLDGVRITTVRSHDGRHDRVSQQHAALPALFAAVEPDPLHAAIDALFAAVVAHGARFASLLADLRREFPRLGLG